MHHELAEHRERTLTLLTKFHFDDIICITCVFHNLLCRVSGPKLQHIKQLPAAV